jgi:hypothetical protein
MAGAGPAAVAVPATVSATNRAARNSDRAGRSLIPRTLAIPV